MKEPKSIWKRPMRLPQLLGAWLTLMVVTMIIFVTSMLIHNEPISKTDIAMVILAGAISASVLLGVWLFIRWISHWHNLKRTLFAMTCLVTLIALFYAEENWRGRHAWNQFKQEWEAKGEHFDLVSIMPKPVPDEQNSAMNPVWIATDKLIFQNSPDKAKAWYGDRINDPEVSGLVSQLPISPEGVTGTNRLAQGSPQVPDLTSRWMTARAIELKPWQDYYRSVVKINPAMHIPVAPDPQTPAADVLLALSKFDPFLEKLRVASALPYSRFPLQYDAEDPASILLPHLAALKRTAQVLQLRALAELQSGRTEKALEDIRLILRLTDGVLTEPILISHLVRIAILQMALQPVWEGLAKHQWSDPQLVTLADVLGKLNFATDYQLSMRGELAFQGGETEYLRHHPDRIPLVFNRNADDGDNNLYLPPGVILCAVPRGWFYQNQLRAARMISEYFIPLGNINQGTFSPALARRADEKLKAEIKSPNAFNILERLMVPALGNSARKFAWAQSSVDLARTAIALDSYRLAHGDYPESLTELAPQFIAKVPLDVIGGKPLRYRRDGNGMFVLYSIGWNETDDGGVVVFKLGSSSEVDISQADWVWRYPKVE